MKTLRIFQLIQIIYLEKDSKTIQHTKYGKQNIWYLHITYYPIPALNEAPFFPQGYFFKFSTLLSYIKGIIAIILTQAHAASKMQVCKIEQSVTRKYYS